MCYAQWTGGYKTLPYRGIKKTNSNSVENKIRCLNEYFSVNTKAERGLWVPLSVVNRQYLLFSVINVGSLGNALLDDGEGCFTGPLQRILQGLFLLGGEGGQDPVGQVELGVGLGADADLDPGEVLGTNLSDDGLDAVVTTGGAVGPDAQAAGDQGDIVKHDDDSLGRDVEVGGKLQDAAAGQIHEGLGLEQHQLAAVPGGLTVQALELHAVDLAAEGIGQNVDGTEASVVTGLFIFTAGIAQADNEPGFVIFIEHNFLKLAVMVSGVAGAYRGYYSIMGVQNAITCRVKLVTKL